jgi:hypothetical protein
MKIISINSQNKKTILQYLDSKIYASLSIKCFKPQCMYWTSRPLQGRSEGNGGAGGAGGDEGDVEMGITGERPGMIDGYEGEGQAVEGSGGERSGSEVQG